jgi:hypothetical protein
MFLLNNFRGQALRSQAKSEAGAALGASVPRLRTALSTAFVDNPKSALRLKGFAAARLLIRGAAATVTRIFFMPRPSALRRFSNTIS